MNKEQNQQVKVFLQREKCVLRNVSQMSLLAPLVLTFHLRRSQAEYRPQKYPVAKAMDIYFRVHPAEQPGGAKLSFWSLDMWCCHTKFHGRLLCLLSQQEYL
eukprot:maker-scaffold_1-snap-gene-29.46-mRNA-1 protein AED:0.43 eAED:0.89 QI:0/0/0.33/1/0/0/3/13/101